MKTILIIYPHWPPSNLVGVHRVRLIANYLRFHGWHPIILTVHPKHYEELPDPDLEKTVHPDVEVVRTKAFPVLKIAGKRLLGDIGLRAFVFTYRTALDLIKQQKIDFIWISIPSWYSALLGRLLHFKTKTPYGIDYQDPWINRLAPYHHIFLKAWWTRQLARLLEPIAVKRAVLISGVAQPYYADVLKRYFTKRPVQHVAIQLGFDPQDHQIKLSNIPLPWPTDGSVLPYIYAGAFLPQSHLFIQQLFSVVASLQKENSIPPGVKLYFLGTGQYEGVSIADYARMAGISDLVTEVRERFPYLHILHFLSAACGVMIIGSTERHYTASKTFQCLLSGKPVFAMFHGASEAAGILRQCKADPYLVTYNEEDEESLFGQETLETFKRFLHPAAPWSPDLDAIKPYSADRAAQSLSEAIDRALS